MKGGRRGTFEKPHPRYAKEQRVAVEDEGIEPVSIATSVQVEKIRSILSHNDSPDIPFETSINPYRGCEHGCIYCYARPTHAYLGLSPGLDFETRLFAKPDAAKYLRLALSKPSYRCTPTTLGANTDPYQPIERRWRITREIIEVLHEFRHPFTVVTKSHLVERDLELLAEMAKRHLVRVFLSVTTLDRGLARVMEPRASAPERRLETIRRLCAAGIETGLLFAPVIPALNDHEMEDIMRLAAKAGACCATYVLLRLPREVELLFSDWLEEHFPNKKQHILNLIRQLRRGKLNEPRFHHRFRGHGPYAEMIAQRFKKCAKDVGLRSGGGPLATNLYQPGGCGGRQLPLFRELP